MKTAYITHPDCLKHEIIGGHPEDPQRRLAIQDQLQSKQLWDFLKHFESPIIEKQALLYAHSQQYIDSLFNNAPKAGESLYSIDSDTFMNQYTLDAALRAAGAGTMAVDLVMEKQIDNAFCAVRPPGHHAEKNQAMGFCFINNIAVAAYYALEKYNLDRIAIVDFDVHFGNGTENIFKNDPRVMVCSSYQHPLYPFTNPDSTFGRFINSPLKIVSDGSEFRKAVQEQWLPELEAFKPQLIFVSAGFDAHWEDEIAQLQLDETDYAWVTRKITHIANKYPARHYLLFGFRDVRVPECKK